MTVRVKYPRTSEPPRSFPANRISRADQPSTPLNVGGGGDIAAAIAAHEAGANPHPTYLTEAEADALYADISVTPITPRRVVGMTFEGGGSTPTPGSVGYVVVLFSGTIDQWSIVADQSGSAVVDVWKVAGAIPTDANRIAGTEKLTLSAQQLASDTSLSTWTTAVTAGDVFGFELESVTTCTRVTAELRISESA